MWKGLGVRLGGGAPWQLGNRADSARSQAAWCPSSLVLHFPASVTAEPSQILARGQHSRKGGMGRGPPRGRSGPQLLYSSPGDKVTCVGLSDASRGFCPRLWATGPAGLWDLCLGIQAPGGAATWPPHIPGGGPVGLGAT